MNGPVCESLGEGIYLIAAEMFEKSSLKGFSQQMLAQYIASLDATQELPGRALLLKSKLEVQSDNCDDALATIMKATSSDHSNSSVWAQLGRIHLKMNNIQQAKEAFERAVAYEKVRNALKTSVLFILWILGARRSSRCILQTCSNSRKRESVQ